MFRVAMPIAHVQAGDEGPAPYGQFYLPDGASKYSLAAEFDMPGTVYEKNKCPGLHITKTILDQLPIQSDYNLYAFTDGYISVIGARITLRLVRGQLFKLKADGKLDKAINYGAAREAMKLIPQGPQLRHVVYQFTTPPPESLMMETILGILNNPSHPGRRIMRYTDPLINGGNPILLDDYLKDDIDGSRAEFIAQEVIFGFMELFVQAGDIIANFSDVNTDVIVAFHDSCGHVNVEEIDETGLAPGRPINASYYLYQVQAAVNISLVSMLTKIIGNPIDHTQSHPLNFLLSPARVTNIETAIDLGNDHPPKPLQLTTNVTDASGQVIAEQALLIDRLGEFHQSMNASNPSITDAVVQWRIYGTQLTDVNFVDKGKIILEAIAAKQHLIPSDIDYTCTPQSKHNNKVRVYWARYGAVINAVASSLQIPCEVMMAIACTETNPDDTNNITDSHEMDVIRMEPLKGTPAEIAPDNAAHQTYLTHYNDLAKKTGANADIPIPWSNTHAVEKINSSHNVVFTSPLTWGQLAEVAGTYLSKAIVSPGIAQVTLANISPVIGWIESIYGAGYLSTIRMQYNGIELQVQDIPASGIDVFSRWFGTSVDAEGAFTDDPAIVSVEMTKIQRAFHDIAISGAYLKQRCNFMITSKSNLVSDFDVVTHLGSYNDGGNGSKEADQLLRTTAATAEEQDKFKWKCLFDLLVFSDYYPNDCPKYYNAVVNFFNTEFTSGTPSTYVQPSVRLWHG